MKLVVQGAETHVADVGEGPSLLLLHGNPDSADLWEPVAARLAPRFRCLAPDLPGFARSALPPGFDFSLPALASWVDALVDGLVDTLGVDPPLGLVVHDFGGPFGLAWAVEHPRRVRGIVVIDSLFSTRLRWHPWARIWRTPLLGELVMALTGRALFRRELRRGGPGLSDAQIEAAWRHVGPRARRTVLRLYRATDPQVFHGWEERLAALAREVPVKVLWGRLDPYLDPALATTFGSDDVEVLDGVGHWPPAEAPDVVAARLAAFFA